MKTLLLNAYVNGSFDVKTDCYEWSFVIFDNCDRIVAERSGVVNSKEFYKRYSLTYLYPGEKCIVGEMSAAMRATLFAAKNNAKIKLHHTYNFTKRYAKEALSNDDCLTTAYCAFMKRHNEVVADFVHVGTYFGKKSRDIHWISDKLSAIAIHYKNKDKSYFSSDEYDDFYKAASELYRATNDLVWLTKGDFDDDDIERIDKCADFAYFCAEACKAGDDDYYCGWAQLNKYEDVLENLLVLVNEK